MTAGFSWFLKRETSKNILIGISSTDMIVPKEQIESSIKRPPWNCLGFTRPQDSSWFTSTFGSANGCTQKDSCSCSSQNTPSRSISFLAGQQLFSVMDMPKVATMLCWILMTTVQTMNIGHPPSSQLTDDDNEHTEDQPYHIRSQGEILSHSRKLQHIVNVQFFVFFHSSHHFHNEH